MSTQGERVNEVSWNWSHCLSYLKRQSKALCIDVKRSAPVFGGKKGVTYV